MNAANALGKIGDTRAIEPLIKAVKLDRRIVNALGWFRDNRMVKLLIAECCFASVKENWGVLEIIIEPLARLLSVMAAETATEDLRKLATLKDNYVSGGYSEGCFPGGGSYTPPSGVHCFHLRQLARQELIRRGIKA